MSHGEPTGPADRSAVPMAGGAARERLADLADRLPLSAVEFLLNSARRLCAGCGSPMKTATTRARGAKGQRTGYMVCPACGRRTKILLDRKPISTHERAIRKMRG